MSNVAVDDRQDSDCHALMKRIANSTDLLCSILTAAMARGDAAPTPRAAPLVSQTVILTDCQVTIHQHVSPPLETAQAAS